MSPHLTYKIISTIVGHIYPYCGNVPTLCVLVLKLCVKLESNQAITFGAIAFLRMGLQKVCFLHLKAGEYSVSLSYSVLRTDKYHNVRVRVPLLPEIGKTPILADLYVVSISLNSVAIRTCFSASVTGTYASFYKFTTLHH